MLAAADLDLDPATTELVISATAANTQIVKHDGTTIRTMPPDIAGGDSLDQTAMLDLLSYPAIADFDGDTDLDIIKGMISAAGAANLLLVGQNLPFNHLISAWDATTGENLPTLSEGDRRLRAALAPGRRRRRQAGVAGAPSDGVNEIVVGTGHVPAARLQPGRPRARGLAEAHRRLARPAARAR